MRGARRCANFGAHHLWSIRGSAGQSRSRQLLPKGLLLYPGSVAVSCRNRSDRRVDHQFQPRLVVALKPGVLEASTPFFGWTICFGRRRRRGCRAPSTSRRIPDCSRAAGRAGRRRRDRLPRGRASCGTSRPCAWPRRPSSRRTGGGSPAWSAWRSACCGPRRASGRRRRSPRLPCSRPARPSAGR